VETPVERPGEKPFPRRVTTLCLLLSALLVCLALSTPVAGAAPVSASTTRTFTDDEVADLYLVLLRRPPLASYAGGDKGLAATAPQPGERFDASRPSVSAYRGLLLDEQADVRAAVGQVAALYSYTTALNGFAAELTASQVKQLGALPEVLAVERSTKQLLAGSHQSGRDRPRTAVAAPGIWSGVGGPAKAGRGVVVGVIDSGIWPENPSFAGIPSGFAALARRYPGFTVSCAGAEQWVEADCNDKVVSARYFVAGFGSDNIAAAEYLSPRDGSGHGSHTAALAAGNAGVSVQINDQHFGKIFGMAPGAGLAVYKACWVAPDPDDDGCTTADTVMAIDQAVNDGVDVLNYSIADAQTPAPQPLPDAVDLAFLNAAAAGVFISTPAGDDGPASSTVAHQSPWVTTVAAVSQPGYQGALTLGNGTRIKGAMVSNRRVGSTRLVDAGDVGSPTASLRHAEVCFPGSLDASLVDGAIVVCERGTIARVAKSQAVNRAGGSAMVLTNRFPGVTNADLHSVPTVHVDRAGAVALERYLTRSLAPTASLAPTWDEPAAERTIAAFSGRGPSTVDADVLKPDLAANGVSVLAAVAPPSNFGRLWDIYSGTSMSAPAIAGLAAMLSARHPDWSAAALKSALLTTANALETDGPLTEGAGLAAPRRMLDPGLVYDAGLTAWLGYLRGRGVSYGGDKQVRAVSGANLNLPSICIGSLVGSDRVTRTVTNVSSRSETYLARVSGVRGVDVSVAPSSLLLAPGESAEFTVTFNARERAHYERFAAGTLTWRGSQGHRVTTPIVVRPQYLRAPDEVTASQADRSTDVVARAGVTGTLRASLVGPVGAVPSALSLQPGVFDPEQPVASSSAVATSFGVPGGTAVARFALAAAHEGDDLDLFVYRDGALVASADSLAGDEQVTLVQPPSGRYEVYSVSAASNRGTSTPAQLTGWLVPEGVRGKAQISPRPLRVTGGRLFDMTMTWGRLDEAKRWFGYVTYAESGRRTYVTLD